MQTVWTLKLARIYISFFLSVYIWFQTQQSEEENRFRIVFRILLHSQQLFFVLIFYLFCLAVIQILRLGEFNSHSLYIPPVLASSRCQRINVSLYYYLKGIFIFLLSILRWKYAVWRSTSVVYKKLVWDLIGMCNVTSRNSINLKCKSLWNEAPFNRLVKRVWRGAATAMARVKLIHKTQWSF